MDLYDNAQILSFKERELNAIYGSTSYVPHFGEGIPEEVTQQFKIR